MCFVLKMEFEEKKSEGENGESGAAGGVEPALLCLREAPVLQLQGPGGHHQTTCGEHNSV